MLLAALTQGTTDHSGGELRVHLRRIDSKSVHKPLATFPHDVHSKNAFYAAKVGAELYALGSFEEP